MWLILQMSLIFGSNLLEIGTVKFAPNLFRDPIAKTSLKNQILDKRGQQLGGV